MHHHMLVVISPTHHFMVAVTGKHSRFELLFKTWGASSTNGVGGFHALLSLIEAAPGQVAKYTARS